jgi:hypothetical protein
MKCDYFGIPVQPRRRTPDYGRLTHYAADAIDFYTKTGRKAERQLILGEVKCDDTTYKIDDDGNWSEIWPDDDTWGYILSLEAEQSLLRGIQQASMSEGRYIGSFVEFAN